jgi:hypothetical protein
MKIVNLPPPNWDAILQVFPHVATENVVFTYGNVIYNPRGKEIPQEIIEHESVHAQQQREYGIEKWWKDYLKDKKFRFDQELPAHRMEYYTYCRMHKDRNERVRFLEYLSGRLAGPEYGDLTTKAEAKRLITS